MFHYFVDIYLFPHNTNGRRYYTEKDLKRLEKICLLKSLSVSLDDIKTVLDKKSFKELLLHQQQQTFASIEEAENNETECNPQV
ncbi:MerR family transcriptional regulator [Peribacillus sp. RS7]